jgi:predicted RNase H-like HicB family nuclease
MAQTHQFLVNLIFDPEYHGYVVDVPQLPGCMSQGKTVEAALKNVRKAIAAYLKVPQPPTADASLVTRFPTASG